MSKNNDNVNRFTAYLGLFLIGTLSLGAEMATLTMQSFLKPWKRPGTRNVSESELQRN